MMYPEQVLPFPNNKTFVTKKAKACIDRKKLCFRDKERVGVAAAQRELKHRRSTAVVLSKAYPSWTIQNCG